MLHIMFDLETLSTDPKTVIMECGFATFEPQAEGIVSSGTYLLDVEEQLTNGRKVSFDTLQWWLKQSEEARAKVHTRDNFSILTGFEFYDSLQMHFDWTNISGVWSHGVAFDIVILENFFQQMKRAPFWNYRQLRDTRTLFSLYPVTVVKPTIAHSAEADAIAQALSVQLAYKAHEALRSIEIKIMSAEK